MLTLNIIMWENCQKREAHEKSCNFNNYFKAKYSSLILHLKFHSIIMVMSELFMESGKPSMTLSVSLATKELWSNNTK